MGKLLDIVKLSNDLCLVLIDMERKGMKIDMNALQDVKHEYQEEYERLTAELQEMIKEAMGDTPINLNSPEQVSMLLYSRKVKDKKIWSELFNLGMEERGAGKKPKRPKKYPKSKFGKLINYHTDILYKTKKEICNDCNGTGKIAKSRKDGTLGNARFICHDCSGSGVVYRPLSKVAGFRLVPRDVYDLSSHGFATDKDILESRLVDVKGTTKNFIEKMVRINALTTYLSTFIGGIEKFVGADDILHTSFMQTITATGRLSSQRPNLHNQPRGTTFPVKRCFTSRFEQGKLIETDFSTLEFCIAAELSRDAQAIRDVRERLDVHTRTANILTKAGQPTDRQGAKPHTFKPLYGGLSGTGPEKVYYRSFLSDLYPDVGKWHEELCERAYNKQIISIPSGREYSFPGVVKFSNGSVSNSTQIKNYPVQGFATADIVPLVAVQLFRQIKGRHSCIVNIVHDSIVIDTHPDEIEEILKINNEVFSKVHEYVKEYFDYEMVVPIRFETKIGNNWFAMEKV